MAARTLAEVRGGSSQQFENVAEIGMEHHLGLTPDPAGGLVEILRVERDDLAGRRHDGQAGRVR